MPDPRYDCESVAMPETIELDICTSYGDKYAWDDTIQWNIIFLYFTTF